MLIPINGTKQIKKKKYNKTKKNGILVLTSNNLKNC